MRFSLVLILLAYTLYANNDEHIVKEAIVKIYTVYKSRNYLEPWNVSVKRANGSGAVIAGNRILTNAHVVANSTFIEVKHSGETKRYKAHVIAVSHQADLALLGVDDENFFNGITPLQIDALPQMRQKVSIYGFPSGGTTLSISDGIVSRIEHFSYKHSRENFLGIQVDAAINPGNSGGPAISEGKIIGVVMQNMPRAQNIGYLVPTPVIQHFLDDIKDGKNDGFAAMGIVTENLENPAIRAFHGLSDEQSGQLVTYITYNETQDLHVNDILTAIDGHNIENDGTVNFRDDAYTEMKYYIDLKQMGETVIFDVIRDGKNIKVPYILSLKINELLLVKILQYDTMPTYCIYGGYLFSPLTSNLLGQSQNIPMRLNKFVRFWPSEKRKDIVVLIKVLADSTNRGNHSLTFWAVDKLNGIRIESFAHFKQMLHNADTKFITLEDEDGYKIMIDVEAAKANEKELLQRYNIAKACLDSEAISAD